MDVSNITEDQLKGMIEETVQRVVDEKLKMEEDEFEKFSKSSAGRIIRIEERMVTKEELRDVAGELATVKASMATRDDLRHVVTKEELRSLSGEVAALKGSMATKDDLRAERYWTTFIMTLLLTIFGIVMKYVIA